MTLPAGWLEVTGIRFACVIGVSPAERERPREMVADLAVRVDFHRAAAADSVDATVDYRALTRRLAAAGRASRCQLVETLATRLARTLLDEFPQVEEIRVALEKPGALAAARSVRAIVSARRATAGGSRSAGRPRARGSSGPARTDPVGERGPGGSRSARRPGPPGSRSRRPR